MRTGSTRRPRVALFDYGVGNLHSLGKALEEGGAEVVVSRDWDEALAMDALVLPGVGAFSAAVEALPEDRARIRQTLEAGLPCLGICLGMQILFDESEEGPGRGIGIVPGRVRRLRAGVIPQMGWNVVETGADPLFDGVDGAGGSGAVGEAGRPGETGRSGEAGRLGDARRPGDAGGDPALTAYYANSFVCEPEDPAHAIAWSTHDGDRFVAAVRNRNTWGAQFHPEKSSTRGRRIIRNFLEAAALVAKGGA